MNRDFESFNRVPKVANAPFPQREESNALTLAEILEKLFVKPSAQIGFKEAKKIIIRDIERPNAFHEALVVDKYLVYSTIQRCKDRKKLLQDAEVLRTISTHLFGHDLWRCFLLAQYGSEKKIPPGFQKLWNTTSGVGTDEISLLKVLDEMEPGLKKSAGIDIILRSELSGDVLQEALDIAAFKDTIPDNIFGGIGKSKGMMVFDKRRLRKLIKVKFSGASTIRLRKAMEVLYQMPVGGKLKNALVEIEEIRELEPGAAMAQYKIAMAKQKEGIEYYKKNRINQNKDYLHEKDNPSPPLDTSRHEAFTGSTPQLKFGKVVGDVFGIDAVFGSLISPTGGLVGPGNDVVSLPKYAFNVKLLLVQSILSELTDLPIPMNPVFEKYGAIATHGAFHDAVGYLYNCHGIGPGYDYLKNEPGQDPGNPLVGQTNSEWWVKEFKKMGINPQWRESIGAKATVVIPLFLK